ncbi:MAG TPA: hypothetical protein VKG05_02450 [Steroidobacteraceae bacterium]|nr:hypothetical protein [Steroidobacteraceae bacterium]
MHSSAKISRLVAHALLLASAALAASSPADWRPLDPENTLYLELASGRVVIELAPAYAPCSGAIPVREMRPAPPQSSP